MSICLAFKYHILSLKLMATVIITTYICSIFSKPTWESCVPVFWMLQFYNCCQGQKIKVKDDRMAKN